ncbi:hypothetical protein ACFL2V_07430 [Pseudomonadota bacterium]
MVATASTARRFDVALSFPGEHRDYLQAVATHLSSEFSEARVLYDHYHDAEFARLDLDVYLPNLYRTESELIVIALCPEYANKRWCNLEWRQIRQLISTIDAERIMFLSMGDPGDLSDIGILSGDGYIDVTPHTPEAITAKIIKRLNINRGIPTTTEKAATIPADISRIDKYAPTKLIGREDETQVLNDAWNQAVNNTPKRPHLLTFVALGGEGKTSLVAKWAAQLAHDDWPGCEAVFAWSFYSQGTKEQTAANSDLFLDAALAFFGDREMANSAKHGSEKGKRLAQLVGAKRALLILDGVEPLQYAPTSPMPGEFKDDGLVALIKGLAANNQGLCVVTTRYAIPDLNAYKQTAAPEINLKRLSREAGVALLQSYGIKGSLRKEIPFLDVSTNESENLNEFEKLVEDVRGHALTLNLLGTYLRDAHAGDIRKRDLIKLEEADSEEQGGHAFRVMDAYATSLENEGKKGQRALALLRLMGLFDRPAPADCLEALWQGEAIPGLTEPFIGITEAQRNIALTRLEDANLLTQNRDSAGTLLTLDAHPLLREYFAKQLREQHPEAWRAAHRRVYEHLCATTEEGEEPSLADLQPLYQAVAHGCLAGMQQQVCDEVYIKRILRGMGDDGFYSIKKLGALGSDLGAIACFFNPPWNSVSPKLTEAHQAWLLSEAATRLRALGRLNEAVEPMRTGLNMFAKQEAWSQAAASAANLIELQLILGRLTDSLMDANHAFNFTDQSTGIFEPYERLGFHVTHADALHQAGQRNKAERLFGEAETLQVQHQRNFPLLYSVNGFRYCDLLLYRAEREAWKATLNNRISRTDTKDETDITEPSHALTRTVTERTKKTLHWARHGNLSILTIALDLLTLARAALYTSVLIGSSPSSSHTFTQQAVEDLRRAARNDYLPFGLLTRAWLHILENNPQEAQAYLDEAMTIAERGPMPLHMADIYLHRARLFFRVSPYPWHNPDGTPHSAKEDLAEARRLIEKHGYWRRKEELEDAEKVILNRPISL